MYYKFTMYKGIYKFNAADDVDEYDYKIYGTFYDEDLMIALKTVDAWLDSIEKPDFGEEDAENCHYLNPDTRVSIAISGGPGMRVAKTITNRRGSYETEDDLAFVDIGEVENLGE